MRIIRNLSEISDMYTIWTEKAGDEKAELKISKKMNIVKFNVHWGAKNDPRQTYLLVIDNMYILNCAEESVYSSMNMWEGLVQKSFGSNEYRYSNMVLKAFEANRYFYDESNTQLIYAYKHAGYIGDYFFHFGHFFQDALPTIKCTKELYKNTKKFHSIYDLKDFHNELIPAYDIKNIKMIDREVVADKFISHQPGRVGPAWIEVFKSQQIIEVDKQFGVFCHLNKVLENSMMQSKFEYVSERRTAKGLFINRGKAAHQRIKNYKDMIGKRKIRIRGENNTVDFSIEVEEINPEDFSVYERIRIAKQYDFVIGAAGSQMIPTLFYSNVPHFYIVPFIPSQAIVDQFLPSTRYLNEKFEWISDGKNKGPTLANQTVFDKLWFKEYKIDCNCLLNNLIKRIL